jgi:CBS domain-containing protein
MTGSIRSVIIEDVMTREIVIVRRNTKVGELKELFDKHDFNAFPVVENGDLVGIVTKLDFMRIFSVGMKFSLPRYRELFAGEVGQIMREALVTLTPKDSVEKAVEYMVEFGLRSMPVVEGKKLVGMVSRKDLMQHLILDGD